MTNCRSRMIDYSMSDECDTFDYAIGATAALTDKPYCPIIAKLAEKVDKNRKANVMTSPEGSKFIAKAWGALQKKK